MKAKSIKGNSPSEIKIALDDSIGNIKTIPRDIGRVILNLIINAFYAVDEKSKQLALDLSGSKTLTGQKEYEPAAEGSIFTIIIPV
jgi:two-component system NtrC family sensor kinase